VFYHLICICDQIYVANYLLYIFLKIIYYISLYYTGLKYLRAIQFIRSKTIEPAVQPVLNGWTNIEATWSKKMNAMARRAGQAGRAGFAAGEGSLVQHGLSGYMMMILLLLRYERRGALSVWIWIWMDDGSYPYSWLLDTCMAVMSQPLPLPRGLLKCQPTSQYNSTVDSYRQAGTGGSP